MGLTRGRMDNIAIVVASSEAGASDRVADSMQRGTPELTMQDAVRAAEAEMCRASRSREGAVATGPVGVAPRAGHGIMI